MCDGTPTRLAVEVEEQAMVRVADGILDAALHAPPLEMRRHQLVARHHGLLFLRGVSE